MFLPVTMNSAERIVETIQEIKQKIPSNPFEAELILMAEMVAEEDDKQDPQKDKTADKVPERQEAADGTNPTFQLQFEQFVCLIRIILDYLQQACKAELRIRKPLIKALRLKSFLLQTTSVTTATTWTPTTWPAS